MNVRDPKFTTRLERALLHLARRPGKSLEQVAAACSVARADLVAWIVEFNGGSPALAESRIDEVKREVGVVVVVRRGDVPPEAPAAAPAMRLPASLGGPPIGGIGVCVAPAASVVAPGSGQEAVKAWVRRKRELATKSPGEAPAPPELPWRKLATPIQRKAANKWRRVLELIVKRPEVTRKEIASQLSGPEQLHTFEQFRRHYFGSAGACTAEEVRGFLLATLREAPPIGGEAAAVAPAAVVVPAREGEPVREAAAHEVVIRELEVLMDGNQFTLLLAVAGKEPVGTVTLRYRRREIADFHRLFVAEGWRRRGVARALVARCIEIAARVALPAVSCSVRQHNVPARALYQAMGFRAGYQFDDGDLLMSLPLKAAVATEGVGRE